MKKIGLLILCSFFFGNTQAQSFVLSNVLKGSGNVTDKRMIRNRNNLYMLGEFDNDLYLGGDTYNTNGNKDFFLTKIKRNGQFDWLKTGGSSGLDFVTGLAAYQDTLRVVGAFPGTIDFTPTNSLDAYGSYDVFLADYDTLGNFIDAGLILWGPGLIAVQDVAIDGRNLILTGFFKDSLYFGIRDTHVIDTLLNKTSINHHFVIKKDLYNQSGWGKSYKANNNVTRIQAVASGDNAYYFTMYYEDSIYFDTDTLESTTNDYDMALVKLDKSDGSEAWIKKTVGPGDVIPENMIISQHDNSIMCGGKFSGNYILVDSTDTNVLLINSKGGGTDAFVLKYDQSGDLLRGCNPSGPYNEGVNSIAEAGNDYVVAGFFANELVVGEDTLITNGSSDRNGLLGIFNSNLSCQDGATIKGTGDNDDFFNLAAYIDAPYVSGTYLSPNIYVGDSVFTLETSGKTDVLFAKFGCKPISIGSETTTDLSCFKSGDGEIEITASGGFSRILYSVDNGQTYQDSGRFVDLAAGTYNVMVKDTTGCTQSGSELTLNQPDSLYFTGHSETEILCAGDANGEIHITGAAGGVSPYFYSIDGGNTYLDNGGDFTALSADTFELALQDTDGCEFFGDTVILADPDTVGIADHELTDLTCNQDASGEILITAEGGNGVYTYSINGGTNYYDNGGSFTGLGAGSYTLAVKDGNECEYIGSAVDLNEPDSVKISSIVITDLTCYGDGSGRIEISGQGGDNDFLYSINGGTDYYDNGGVFTGLDAGGYTPAVIDTSGCEYIGDVVSVQQPDSVKITGYVPQDPSCYGYSDGSVDISATGGDMDFVYSITGGDVWNDNGGSFTGLSAGVDLYLAVKDGNDCTYLGDTIALIDPDSVKITGYTLTDLTCHDDGSGQIDISAAGGTETFTYSINGGSNYYDNGGSFGGLDAGVDYYLAVKDGNDCEYLGDTVTLTQPVAVGIADSTVTDLTCHGDGSGAIGITAEGGNGVYTYSVNGGTDYYDNGGVFGGLDAGDYTLAVKDGNGCEYISPAQVTLTQPVAVGIADSTVTDLTCHGDGSGAIGITAEGGNGVYTYSVNGGTDYYDNGGVFGGLDAGDYTLAVKDGNGCEYISPAPVTLTQPDSVKITGYIPQDPSCYGYADGSVDISATGGDMDFVYSITGGDTWMNNTGVFTGLDAGVELYLAVKDGNDCTYLGDTIVLSDPDSVKITGYTLTDLTCHDDGSGQIDISAAGGTETFTYSINGGSNYYDNGGSFGGLDAGVDYYLAVKDGNDCEYLGDTVTLTQPVAVGIADSTVTDLTCHGDGSGAIGITAEGGNGVYTYSVNGGTDYYDNGGVFGGLDAGDYTLAVKDGNGCEYVSPAQVTLTQPDSVKITGYTLTDLTCHGDGSGQIDISAAGGTETFTYSINGGSNYYDNGGSFGGLDAGVDYYLAVKDGNDCEYLGDTVTLTQPVAVGIADSTVTDLTCHGDGSGAIGITAEGGNGVYTYSVNGGTDYYDNGGVFGGLDAGDYTLAVKDGNGCEYVSPAQVTLTQPDSVKISNYLKSDLICNGDNSGQVTMSAEGGNGVYTYSINGGTDYYDNGGSFAGLAAGEYYLAVKDGNDCEFLGDTLELTQPVAVGIADSTVTDLTCYGDGTGAISITAEGGNGVYTYSINGGTDYYDNGGSFTGLYAAGYALAVKDGNGCEYISSTPVTITQPDSVKITDYSIIPPDCQGLSDGSVTITATGGNGVYTYSINGGTDYYDNGGVFGGLPSGEYYPAVKDGNDCEFTGDTVTVSDPDSLKISDYTLYDPSCAGDSDGEIKITAEGGNGVYQYSLDGGLSWQSDSVFSDLPSGVEYYLAVLDGNLCEYQGDTVSLDDPLPVGIQEYDTVDISCYGLADGQISITATGGNGVYYYSVNGSDTYPNTTGLFDGLAAGEYQLAVMDTNHCEFIGDTVDIDEPDSLYIVDVDTVMVSTHGGSDGSITVTPAGGTPPYGYALYDNPPQADSVLSGLPADKYVVKVTDASGCGPVETDTIWITEPDVGIEDLFDEENLRVYPNPNKGQFTIEFRTSEPDVLIELIDLSGRQVFFRHYSIDGTRIFRQTIDLSRAPQGMYMLKINHQATGRTIVTE